MAYFDRDELILHWLAALGDDLPVAGNIHLMATAEESEAEVIDPEPSRGYIIRDWFGPFLLSPAKRYSRGRC